MADNTAILKSKEEILKEASIDELTRFLRRESLTPYLDRLIIDASKEKKPFSVALVDIDHFKKFNDNYGHLFGDQVLKYIASTLRLTLDGAGHIFRYGGDECVIVFPYKEADAAFQLMRKCNYSVANRPFSFKGKLIVITISCGVASFPYNGESPERLLKKADEALYFSKHYGRNVTTLARHLSYKRLMRFLFTVGIIVFLGFGIFILGRYIFSNEIKYFFERFKRVKVITQEPKGLDTITLKSGRIVKGYIINEENGKLEVRFDVQRGEASILIDKQEIKDIVYSKIDSEGQDN